MRSWRYLVVAVLLLLPFGALLAVGLLTVWGSSLLGWLFGLFAVCWSCAYVLDRWWRRQTRPRLNTSFHPPPYWTARDEAAWKLIEAEWERARDVEPQRLLDPHFYLQSAMDVSLAVARHYHPHAKDPVGAMTVPELLTVAQLALEDLARGVADYLPASHLLTVDQWRTLAKTPGWLNKARHVSWAISILLYPGNLSRFAASRLAMGAATRQLRENALAWLYVMFIRQVGFYLIEMNSGRLRGGGDRYRHFVREAAARSPSATAQRRSTSAAAATAEPIEVIIALVGQVKSGKSSLVNALLGHQQAAVDVLPQTKRVDRYCLELEEPGERLVLLDTGGYADDAMKAIQFKETRAAAERADVVLLVMNASDPSRQPDLQLRRDLAGWFAGRPHLKCPPVLGVLTHIDHLSPVMEWTPPYDWTAPSTTKEKSILAAVEYNREQFGDLLTGVIPVCTDAEHERVYGVQEWLLPAVVGLLGEARALALLRTLHAELDSHQFRKVVEQFKNVSAQLLKTYLPSSALQPPGKPPSE